jgi:NACHT domain
MPTKSSSLPAPTPGLPAYLEDHIDAGVDPPVETRAQRLPFAALTPENFERLCVKLVRTESDVELTRLYGTPGQAQQGIDLYARLHNGQYGVYQCKRVHNFTAAKIHDAAQLFLPDHPAPAAKRGRRRSNSWQWDQKAEFFVLCTSESLSSTATTDEIETQRERYKKLGVRFDTWDADELDAKLKDQPKLVDDFFGREGVRAFCGPDAAHQLETRLDNVNVIALRTRLRAFYRALFREHDPGLVPAGNGPDVPPLPLEQRFVVPDVITRVDVQTRVSRSNADGPDSALHKETRPSLTEGDAPVAMRTDTVQNRQPVDAFLTGIEAAVLVGEPGSGKSTVLRAIVLELLGEETALLPAIAQWRHLLPVWLPFPLWTKLIAENRGCSLSDVLQNHLHAHDQSAVWPLVERALTDERLLLLVDGLDEYSDLDLGRIAVQRLGVFRDTQRCKVVAVSRPSGFSKLEWTSSWARATLGGLMPAQQQSLCQRLFSGRASDVSDATQRDAIAERQAKAFVAQANATPALAELAQIPLLLTLLLRIRLDASSLPTNRFEVYERFVAHLVREHPARRRAAAEVERNNVAFEDEEVSVLLGGLALHVQRSTRDAIITVEAARAHLETQLEDSGGQFALSRRDARLQAGRFVDIGETTLGILVKRSQHEIGFFHRALQEQLAAVQLCTQPLSVQTETITKHALDPQWSEVILGMFHITRRSDDALTLFAALPAPSGTSDHLHVDRLTAAIVLAPNMLPALKVREETERILRSVESAGPIARRSDLLRLVVDARHSGKVGALVWDRLERWTANHLNWREGAFRAMTKWPREPDTRAVLLQALHDEAHGVRHAAAASLARVFAGDRETADQLADAIATGFTAEYRVAALEALYTGWRDDTRLPALLEACRWSLHPTLQLFGIAGRVHVGAHDEKDLATMIKLTREDSPSVGYELEPVALRTLLQAWPADTELKRLALNATVRHGRKDNLEPRLAGNYLLSAGFKDDSDVIDWIVRELREEDYPFSIDPGEKEGLELVATHFRHHEVVARAADERLLRPRVSQAGSEYRDVVQDSLIALIARSPASKYWLIDTLTGDGWIHWTAAALLEAWGIADPEVHDALRAVVASERADRIAHHIPQILVEPVEARGRLLELLRSPGKKRWDFVLTGIERLSVARDDEVFEAIQSAMASDTKDWDADAIPHALVQLFPNRPEIFARAVELLKSKTISSGLFANVYADREEARSLIHRLISPLPVGLRGEIARQLQVGLSSDARTVGVLRTFTLEPDVTVRSVMTRSLYGALRSSSALADADFETLKREFQAGGFDHLERRSAAFCGVAEAGWLPQWESFDSPRYNERDFIPGLRDSDIHPNSELPQLIVDHWEAIRATFPAPFWSVFARDKIGDFLAAICPIARSRPEVERDLLAWIKEHPDTLKHVEVLEFLQRLQPGRTEVLDALLTALTRDQFYDREVYRFATLLARSYGGDAEVHDRIVSHLETRRWNNALLFALCEGWPTSSRLRTLVDELRNSHVSLSWQTYISLTSRLSQPERVLERLNELIHQCESRGAEVYDRVLQPIIQRLQGDGALTQLFAKRLADCAPGSEALTLAGLLLEARVAVDA